MNEQVIGVLSEKEDELMQYLPDFYKGVREFQVLFRLEETELDRLHQSVEDVLDQGFVSTADWGLALWEAELGIPTDIGKPFEQRRSVINSKRRGIGPVSASLLRKVAEAYDRGRILVTIEPNAHRIIVTFIDTKGFPPNLDDVKRAIEETKPAHLDVVYRFRYLMVAEVERMTLAELERTTMDQFAWG
ncbi:YmfQ family protein [Gorillibacterium sp. CAU 1737]|uniref:YmfQ family protein n=1 Tax=Gorillibacterium sp. CAU 1737 TaxID=3140362 RepID=UPI0032614C77